MDTLSLLLDDIRLRGARFLQTELRSPWHIGLRTPGLASFHIVSRGSCLLLQKGQEPVQINTGDIVILPAGQAHSLCDAEGEKLPTYDLLPDIDNDEQRLLRLGVSGSRTELVCGYFQFDAELAQPLVAALPPLMHMKGTDAKTPTWLRIGLMFLANEVAHERPAQQAIINRMADILLIECLRGYVDELPESSGNWLLALRDAALSSALAAMHGDPGHPWSVPELAAIACQSRSAFAARFTQVMGEPPLSYLTRHRLRLAAWQLSYTSQPICRIAEQIGYASDAAFSQAFKRHYGDSPSRYRDTHSQQAG